MEPKWFLASHMRQVPFPFHLIPVKANRFLLLQTGYIRHDWKNRRLDERKMNDTFSLSSPKHAKVALWDRDRVFEKRALGMIVTMKPDTEHHIAANSSEKPPEPVQAAEQLFSALSDVFKLKPEEALRVYREAYGLIASYLADLSVRSDPELDEARTLEHFVEMRDELDVLKVHVQEFVDAKPGMKH